MDGWNQNQPPVERHSRIQSLAFVIAAAVCVLAGTVILLRQIEYQTGSNIELDDKINPNNAPLCSLQRLPGIGVARAEAIIRYRGDFTESNWQRPPFGDCNDLQNVKGIGPKISQNVSEFVRFD